MTTRFSDYVRCYRSACEHVGSVAERFGMFDAKGREIGYRCSTVTEHWVADDAGGSLWQPKYLDRPIWKVRPYPTRNGANYGAILKEKVCFSEDEAKAVAAKMIAAYRKKMAKQFA
jgi:hypothetical protein